MIAAGAEEVAAAELGEGERDGFAGDANFLGELLMGDVDDHAITGRRSGGGLAEVHQRANQAVIAIFENQAGGIFAEGGELGGKLLDELDAHDGLVAQMGEETFGGDNGKRGRNYSFGDVAVMVEAGESGSAAPFVGAEDLNQSSRAGGGNLIGSHLAVMNEVEIVGGVAGLIDDGLCGDLNSMSLKYRLSQQGVKRGLSHRSRRSV